MTQPTEQTGPIWLTQKAFDELTAELEDMKGPRRQSIVSRISAAREEGDLSENGGYHAAREEQGKLEGQIRQLEHVLLHAETTVPDDDGLVSAGKVEHASAAEEPPGPTRRFPRFEELFAGKASSVAHGARQAVEERVVGKAIEIVVGQPFT